MVLHWVALSDEERADSRGTSVPIKIAKAMSPVPKPSALPSFQSTLMASPAIKDGKLTPFGEFPWAKPSPIETTISTGPAEESLGDGAALDTSRIRVKIRHEMSESNFRASETIEDV
jgi:hypothetical protein